MEIFVLEQKEDESLWQWYDRFHTVAAEVEELTLTKKMVAFQRGLWNDELSKNIIIDLPSTFPDLAVRVQRFIAIEESKWGKSKIDLQSSIPGDKKGAREIPKARKDRREGYTPLHRPTIYNSDRVTVEDYNMSSTPHKPVIGRHTNHFCRYHLVIGHGTEECVTLKNEIEKLARAKHLGHYIKGERQAWYTSVIDESQSPPHRPPSRSHSPHVPGAQKIA